MRNTAFFGFAFIALIGTAYAKDVAPTFVNTPGQSGTFGYIAQAADAVPFGPEERARFMASVIERHGDRFAGMWWDTDSKSDRIVVRLTGPGTVSTELHQIDGKPVEVFFETGALNTLAELRAAQEGTEIISKYITPLLMSYADEKTSELVLGISVGDEVARGKAEALSAELGVPVRLEETAPGQLDYGIVSDDQPPSPIVGPAPGMGPHPEPRVRSSMVEEEEHAKDEPDTGPLAAALQERFRDRIAGIYIEREPDFHVVVRLTGDRDAGTLQYRLGEDLVRVVVRTGAPHTIDELRAALDQRETIIRFLPTNYGGYVDERTGDLVLTVDIGSEAAVGNQAALSEALGVPVRVVAEERAMLLPMQQPAEAK